eukprot:g12957.t1
MKVFVGCADAAGTEILKEVVAEVKKTVSDPAAVEELGCGYAEAEAVFSNDDFASGSSVRGIFLCPTGLDSSCRLNQKCKAVRAAPCHDEYTAKMCRLHNNAQVLCAGYQTTGPEILKEMVKTFLTTDFEGGRHADRVGKISCL